MRELLKYSLILVYCFFVQLVFLENVHSFFWFQPFITLFFLLYMPYTLNKWQSVLISFSVGIFLDSLLNSYGVHTSASLFIGLFRPFFLNPSLFNAPARGDEKSIWLNKAGNKFKFAYLGLFILFYQFWVLLLETLGKNFFSIFLPTWILSSIFTLVLILLSEELLFRTFKRKDS